MCSFPAGEGSGVVVESTTMKTAGNGGGAAPPPSRANASPPKGLS